MSAANQRKFSTAFEIELEKKTVKSNKNLRPEKRRRQLKEGSGTPSSSESSADSYEPAPQKLYRKYKYPVGNMPADTEVLAKIQRPTYQIPSGSVLYLFNIYVALEWFPSERYLAQVVVGMQRASDFLFDVSDGLMAFGEVYVGGPKFMEDADIQILSTNRLHPRAGINGLFSEEHQPIRLGRGLWHPRYKVAIPWNEPEGYRTIVHEWAHYALGLKDSYLHQTSITQNGEALIVPTYSPDSYSLMSAPMLWSELDKSDSSSTIQSHFSELTGRATVEGPSRMPVRLPHFYCPSEWEECQLKETRTRPVKIFVPDIRALTLDRSWLYIIRNEEDTTLSLLPQGTLQIWQNELFSRRSTVESPEAREMLFFSPEEAEQLEAQLKTDLDNYDKRISGYIRLRSIVERKTMLRIKESLREGNYEQAVSDLQVPTTDPEERGVLVTDIDKDDIVILVTEVTPSRPSGPADSAELPSLRVYRGVVSNDADPFKLKRVQLASTPTSPPLPRIKPQIAGDDGTFQLVIDFDDDNTPTPDDSLFFPTGSRMSWDLAKPTTVLEGYVLARWDEYYMIYPVSSGGPGPAHEGGNAPPDTAGSMDGEVWILFNPKNDDINKSTKILTTRTHSGPKQLDDRSYLDSYVYSVASSHSLATNQNPPTLVMYYQRPTSGPMASFGYKPMIYRLKNDEWRPVEQNEDPENETKVYAPVDYSYAAIPLNENTACKLVSDQLHVEHYRFGWRKIC